MSSESALLPYPTSMVSRLAPELCADAALVLCDLDGCLVSQGRAFGDAAAFVEACGERIWIVSNNSSDTAQSLSGTLAHIGLQVPADRILLAGEQTLRHLSQTRPDARLSLYAGPALHAAVDASKLVNGHGSPDLVLLCRDPAFSLSDLDRLVSEIEQGAEFWVSNTDRAHPGLAGQTIAETGALLAAVQAILPDAAHRSLGKPDPHLLAMALRSTGTEARHAVFVGDNADTDGDAARAVDVPFIHLVRGRSAS